jgi:hypothetical protein
MSHLEFWEPSEDPGEAHVHHGHRRVVHPAYCTHIRHTDRETSVLHIILRHTIIPHPVSDTQQHANTYTSHTKAGALRAILRTQWSRLRGVLCVWMCTIPIPAASFPWLPPLPLCDLTEGVPYLEHGPLVLVGVDVGHKLRTIGVQPNGHIGLDTPTHTHQDTALAGCKRNTHA